MNYYGTTFWSPTDLTHYGVLGMKWGVRRYQNKDGSLTAAGRKHYGTSGLNNQKAEKLEKNIRDANKPHKKIPGGRTIQNAVNQKRYNANREVTKFAFDLVKQSKELSDLISEARKCEQIETDAYEKWSGNEKLQNQTIKDFLKATGKVDESEYYLKLKGIDAVSDVWDYYTEHTPELKINRERAYDLSVKFRENTKSAFKSALGAYGSKKLKDVGWASSPTLSEYLANKANLYYCDYVLGGDSIFKKR